MSGQGSQLPLSVSGVWIRVWGSSGGEAGSRDCLPVAEVFSNSTSWLSPSDSWHDLWIWLPYLSNRKAAGGGVKWKQGQRPWTWSGGMVRADCRMPAAAQGSCSRVTVEPVGGQNFLHTKDTSELVPHSGPVMTVSCLSFYWLTRTPFVSIDWK